MNISTTKDIDAITNQLKVLIFEYYNDGLYIRTEEFDNICYLNIILLSGKEYEFLLPYLKSLNAAKTNEKLMTEETIDYSKVYLSIDYVEEKEIKKLQEDLNNLNIESKLYHVESNTYERGASDFYIKILLGLGLVTAKGFVTGASEELGKKLMSPILEKFRPYQNTGINSINNEELITYISQQTRINERDLHIKSVKNIEDENMVEVLIVNRYKEIVVKCTNDLKTINYEIKNKTQTMI